MTSVPPIPARMAHLPLDKHGRPVPWFVAWIDGQPDHRIARGDRLGVALRERRCWICGRALRGNFAFPIGTMCAVNLVTAEPPSHRECAVYSAQACPFLTTPRMRRRESGIPEDAVEPAGEMLRRNPGATAIWVTKSYRTEPAQGGVLFRLGAPVRVEWFAQGRPATRGEVLESIGSGLPALREMAAAESPAAVAELESMTAAAMRLVPAEVGG